jgi:uncharacterized OsmC-like protein
MGSPDRACIEEDTLIYRVFAGTDSRGRGHEVERDDLRARQEPLKEQYRAEPDAARITLSAQGTLGEGVTCSVATGRAVAQAGLHPATGGDGLSLCSGDMLLEALAACAGVTLQAVATSLDVPVRGGTVRVEGDLDFRGTLAVSKEAPVGFTAIRVAGQEVVGFGPRADPRGFREAGARRAERAARIAVETVDCDVPTPPRDGREGSGLGLGFLPVGMPAAVGAGADRPACGRGFPRVLGVGDSEEASRQGVPGAVEAVDDDARDRVGGHGFVQPRRRRRTRRVVQLSVVVVGVRATALVMPAASWEMRSALSSTGS